MPTEIEELTEAFNDWFIDLLHDQPTCLYRDVLRDCKDQLKAAFIQRKPVWTSKELDDAKEEAQKLMKVFSDDK
jgi:uncharacterized protein YwgA